MHQEVVKGRDSENSKRTIKLNVRKKVVSGKGFDHRSKKRKKSTFMRREQVGRRRYSAGRGGARASSSDKNCSKEWSIRRAGVNWEDDRMGTKVGGVSVKKGNSI